jgi:hypothetical protein
MNDDNLIGGILLGVFALLGVVFLVGTTFGFDDGVEKGKNDGIVYCMENQKQCKTIYDYLKLQKNQK